MPSLVDGEDRQRQLEDDAAGEHRGREEAVVVAGADLDVELGVVEVEQELDRGRHHHEVGEGDAGEEEDRDEDQDRQDDAALAIAEGRQHVGVEPGRAGSASRGSARRRRETVRVVVKGSVMPKVSSFLWSLGQRAGGDFQQQVVLPEAERQGDAEDDAGRRLCACAARRGARRGVS